MQDMVRFLIIAFFISSVIRKFRQSVTPERKEAIKKRYEIPAQRPAVRRAAAPDAAEKKPVRAAAPRQPKPEEKPQTLENQPRGFSSMENLPETPPPIAAETGIAPPPGSAGYISPLGELSEENLVRMVLMSEVLGKPKAYQQ